MYDTRDLICVRSHTSNFYLKVKESLYIPSSYVISEAFAILILRKMLSIFGIIDVDFLKCK